MITRGQTEAASTAFSVSQPPVAPVGFPKSSRVAVAVAETGFHAAIAPSHPGIVSAETNTVDRNPNGQTSACTAVVAPALRNAKPRKMPLAERPSARTRRTVGLAGSAR